VRWLQQSAEISARDEARGVESTIHPRRWRGTASQLSTRQHTDGLRRRGVVTDLTDMHVTELSIALTYESEGLGASSLLQLAEHRGVIAPEDLDPQTFYAAAGSIRCFSQRIMCFLDTGADGSAPNERLSPYFRRPAINEDVWRAAAGVAIDEYVRVAEERLADGQCEALSNFVGSWTKHRAALTGNARRI